MPNFQAQIEQDRLVLEILDQKHNGTFVDIGCGWPMHISNTFVLETEFDWTGIGIDVTDMWELERTWISHRPRTKCVNHDALDIDYIKLFEENNMPETIDYLSLDLEPPQLTLECLMKIPFDKYKFNVVTFETDEYRDGDGQRRVDISRAHMEKYDYKLLGSIERQDDLYIHNSVKLVQVPIFEREKYHD